MTVCDGCGFVYDSVPLDGIGDSLRVGARSMADAALMGYSVRQRPAPDVWSSLEYACHVRDVLQVQLGRVARALAEDTPSVVPMGRDERVLRLRYNHQDPHVVREQVIDAADALADVFDVLDDEQLDRALIYNWPVQEVRSLGWVGRHTVHELIHHRLDVEGD